MNAENSRHEHPATRILIVEDDPDTQQLIRQAMEEEGHQCRSSQSLRDAMNQLRFELPDLVLLDRVLPGGDGLRILNRLREVSSLPVLMLTSLRSEDDRVEGLEQGADDYLPKPFSIRELKARVRALLRRSEGRLLQSGLECGPLRMDPEGRQAIGSLGALELSPLETRVLKSLLLNQGRVLRRDELIELAWGVEYDGYDRAVDTLIKRLRRKIEGPGMPGIRTVRGQGYLLDPQGTTE
jgi:DNA-binding response OmpR family regulator